MGRGSSAISQGSPCGVRDKRTPLVLLCGTVTVFTIANLTLGVLISGCRPIEWYDGSTRGSDYGTFLVVLWPMILALNVTGGTVMIVACLCGLPEIHKCVSSRLPGSPRKEPPPPSTACKPPIAPQAITVTKSGADEATGLLAVGPSQQLPEPEEWEGRRLPLIFLLALGLSLTLSYTLAFIGPVDYFEPVMVYVAKAHGFTWRPLAEETLRLPLKCNVSSLLPVADCEPGQSAPMRNSVEGYCRRAPTPSPHFNPATRQCECDGFFGNDTAAQPSGATWGDAHNFFDTAAVCRDNEPPVVEGDNTTRAGGAAPTPEPRPRVTFVTSFINIGRRDEHDVVEQSSCYYVRPFIQWAQLEINLEIFASPEVMPTLLRVRSDYGQRERTNARLLRTWEDVPFGQYRLQMYRNVLKSVWRSATGWFQRGRDGLIPEYGLVQHAKIGFLRHVILNNTFGSDFFFWVDFGAGYDEVQFRGPAWCPCTAAVRGAVTFASRNASLVRRFDEAAYWGNPDGSGVECKPTCGYWTDKLWTSRLDEAAAPVGGMWGGDKEALLEFHALYSSLLEQMTFELGFVDTDQPLYALAYNRDPGYLRLLHIPGDGGHTFYPYRGFC